MGLPIEIGEQAIYATKGSIAFPGSSADRTAAQTFAASDIQNHVNDQTGSGITVSAAAIVLAR